MRTEIGLNYISGTVRRSHMILLFYKKRTIITVRVSSPVDDTYFISILTSNFTIHSSV